MAAPRVPSRSRAASRPAPSSAGVRTDTERLDWLESQIALGRTARAWGMTLGTYLDVRGREYDAEYEGDDVRSAIDAAIVTGAQEDPDGR